MNDDLTFEKYQLSNADHVKGNTSEGFRYLPLTPSAKEILNQVKRLNPSGDYIFMVENRQLYTSTVNDHLKRCCERIGVIPRTSHKIRFTVASMLYDSGMPLTDLQRLLGHSTTSMTLHYLRKVTPEKSTVNMMKSCLG